MATKKQPATKQGKPKTEDVKRETEPTGVYYITAEGVKVDPNGKPIE